MKNEEIQTIALLRYGIIAPLVTDNLDEDIVSKEEFFRRAAAKEYTLPNGKKYTFSPTTIKGWYLNYNKEGIDALKPKQRSDYGFSRKLDDDIKEHIIYLKSEHPRLPATSIYQDLISKNIITKLDTSLSTVTRFIKTLKTQDEMSKKQYKRYEKEFCNQLWYGDTSHIGYVIVDGKKTKAYLIALIDDASRLITGHGVFTADTKENLMLVMKSGISKYGLPKLFTFDNGSNYKNKQIELLAARITTALNYAPPYTPTSKSKIERWFRTFKEQCLSTFSVEEKNSLEVTRKKVDAFIKEYNNRVHSSLKGLSPIDRFYKDSSKIKRLSDYQIETCFLLEDSKKVSKDNIIKMNGVEYEVDYRYSNQRITVRYEADMSKVYIVDDKGNLEEIKLLNKTENSKVKRVKTSLVKEEE